jgi:hypothetical protein
MMSNLEDDYATIHVMAAVDVKTPNNCGKHCYSCFSWVSVFFGT